MIIMDMQLLKVECRDLEDFQDFKVEDFSDIFEDLFSEFTGVLEERSKPLAIEGQTLKI